MTVILIPFFVCSCASVTKSVPFLAKKDEAPDSNLNNATETPVQENTQPTEGANQEDARSPKTDNGNKNTISEEEVEQDVVDTYIADEMNFEIKKVKAELKHAKTEIRELKAKSEIWTNPLSIYNKEIILNNGSTIFGKIVYQDKDILKAETLIGYLTIDRNTIVRIVENVSETPPEKIEQQIIQNAGIDTRGTSGIDFLSNKAGKDGANVILLSRNTKELSEQVSILTKKLPKQNFKYYVLDITNSKDVSSVFNEILKDFKSIDVLVNNAGTTSDNIIARMTDEQWHDVVHLENYF